MSYLDTIAVDDFSAYQNQVENSCEAFRLFPVSFSPIIEKNMLVIWVLIEGDFEEFTRWVKKSLSSYSFPKAKIVSSILKNKNSRTFCAPC